MNVTASVETHKYATAEDNVSKYDELLKYTKYEKLTTGDDDTKPPSAAYKSLHDDQCYTALAQSSSDNIQTPPTHTKYPELLDDEGKLGNPPKVPPPRVDKNTQQQPVDTKYLVLLDDEGRLGNPPEAPPPRVDNKT